jgi:CRP/FNR family transcriptional regulator
MDSWVASALGQTELDAASIKSLLKLKPRKIKAGSVLFSPGEVAKGFVLVVSGRVGVHLVGSNGREIRLYDVKPGETCIQTTLGLLGEEVYSGEAIAETDCEIAIVPVATFNHLLATSDTFRTFVFRAMGVRFQSVMHVLEQVAFIKIESRLIELLLNRADSNGVILATHQELATDIGTAREVVSRRLEKLCKSKFILLERGSITILDRAGLWKAKEQPAPM